LFTSLSAYLRTGPFHFQVQFVRGDQTWIFLFYLFCVVVYFVTDACRLFSITLVFQYSAKRFAGKNVSEMTCFVSGWT